MLGCIFCNAVFIMYLFQSDFQMNGHSTVCIRIWFIFQKFRVCMEPATSCSYTMLKLILRLMSSSYAHVLHWILWKMYSNNSNDNVVIIYDLYSVISCPFCRCTSWSDVLQLDMCCTSSLWYVDVLCVITVNQPFVIK